MFKAILSEQALEIIGEVGLPGPDWLLCDGETGLATLVWYDDDSYQQILRALHAAASNKELLHRLAVRYENPAIEVEERMRLWARWLISGLMATTVN